MTTTRPAPLTGRDALVAGALDLWLDAHLSDHQLWHRLAQIRGHHLDHPDSEHLATHLATLRDLERPDDDPDGTCDRCEPAELCAWHRAEVYLWHDRRDPIARHIATLGQREAS